MSVGTELARLSTPGSAVATPAATRNTLADRLRRDPLHTTVTVILDLAAAIASVALAEWWGADVASQSDIGGLLWLFVPLLLLMLAAASMYRRPLRRNFLDEIGPVETAVALAALVLLSWLLLDPENVRPGAAVIRVWVLATVLVPTVRMARVLIQRYLRNHLGSASPTLVVGDDRYAHQLITRMIELPEYGLRPVGIVASADSGDGDAPPPRLHPNVPHLGTLSDFPAVAAATRAEDLILSQCDASDDELVTIIRSAHALGMRVWVLPRVHDVIGAHARIEHLGGLPLLVLPKVNPRGWQFAVKHALGRVITAFGLLLISPLFLGLALLVRLSSPGPIFFRQKRVGRDGVVFDCLKFRSMRPPSESDAAFELTEGAAPGGVEGVDRRTRIGKIMRQTSLDELPQLLNVLRGDMSLVGPRPERPEFVELFEMQIRRYGERHRVKAGLTGWAQVHGLRGQTSIADRAEWDNYYIENWSLWLDVKILFLTVLAVLKRAED
ncbi:sugar transferase [Mycolicibacterium madagascariense]|uniref:sugar transferase n=1 Tax=Mycolicibacterium madagascariense TaxID=212765 RepID=UPI001FE703E5|nr:sugar transferase [Mycolicibacterium madagascariense]